MNIKDRMYDYLVRRHDDIRTEYENYVAENLTEHKENRLKHWKMLLGLNWKHRFETDRSAREASPVQDTAEKQSEKTTVSASGRSEPKKSEKKNAPRAQVRVVYDGGTYVDLEWNPVKGAVCYNIYDSRDGRQYRFSDKVTEPLCRVQRLDPGKTYYIRIKYSFNGQNYKDDLEITKITTRTLDVYERIFGTKRIWTDGPESGYRRMMTAMNMAKGLMRYEVISFDIFDTLIFRPFARPSDLHMITGQKLGIMDFHRIRLEAEQEARERAVMERGNPEITIREIYEILERKTGVPVQQGIEAEFETETDLCTANPYMKRVFDLMRCQGRTIILVSDMYYPAEMLDTLLHSCGYEGYSRIFVSCEHNCSKRDGGLYEILKNTYSSLVHVGDNQKSDIEMAQKAGVPAVKYFNVNEHGSRFRAEQMSGLTGSVYAGIVNAHLHCGLREYSPYYETGFVYAGIYVFGFCQWITKKAREKGIDRILFLAREGDIYKKVFDLLDTGIETRYVLWSRVPVTKTVVRKNRHPYLLQLVHHKAHAIYRSRITTLFKRIGIGRMLAYLPEYRISSSEYLTPENEKIIERLLTDHWDELCECYDNDLEQTCEYLREMTGESRSVAVVDVGWSGNNVLQVKYLIHDVMGLPCDVTCLLAAAREVNPTYMNAALQSAELETYLFSGIENRFLHEFHQNTNRRLNSFFFEILTQSASPTFLGFEEDRFLFDIPEIENYGRDREIHQGILDFASIYKKTFEKYPYMYQISGHDAYMPFRMLVSDLTFLKKYFSDFVFGRDLFATQEDAVMETVGEVIENAGL